MCVLLGEDQVDEKKMAAGFNWFLVLSAVFLLQPRQNIAAVYFFICKY